MCDEDPIPNDADYWETPHPPDEPGPTEEELTALFNPDAQRAPWVSVNPAQHIISLERDEAVIHFTQKAHAAQRLGLGWESVERAAMLVFDRGVLCARQLAYSLETDSSQEE